MITDGALMFFEKKTMAPASVPATVTLPMETEEYHGLASVPL